MPPSNPPSSGKNHSPFGEVSQAPQLCRPPRPQADSPTAKKNFIGAHTTIFGTPSGKSEFEIYVSEHPRDWCYVAEQKSRLHQGPKTPMEILNPDCPPQYKNQVELTDLKVSACIAPQWSRRKPLDQNTPWLEATFPWNGSNQETVIPLGAVAIPPPAPAEAAWRLHCVINTHRKSAKTTYTGSTETLYCLTLGRHFILTKNLKDSGEELISQIKQTIATRFQG